MSNDKKRILIIRFSAFGDLCQSLFAAEQLKDQYAIDYVTRSDFHTFLEEFKDINKVYSLDRKKGLLGLIMLSLKLRAMNYDIIYDAHSNLRSHIMSFILCALKGTELIRRSKERIKFFMLFKMRKNLLPKPYRGGESYIKPIRKLIGRHHTETPLAYNLEEIHPEAKAVKPYTLLSPFASWPQKMIPTNKWVQFFEQYPNKKFVIVGGPQDKLPDEVMNRFGNQIVDLTGKAKWVPTLHLVHEAEAVVGVDTGVTHVGDLIGKKSYFFGGPSAIGYPSRTSSTTLEVDLDCKPCSKDGRKACTNAVHMKCMKDLDITRVQI